MKCKTLIKPLLSLVCHLQPSHCYLTFVLFCFSGQIQAEIPLLSGISNSGSAVIPTGLPDFTNVNILSQLPVGGTIRVRPDPPDATT